MKLKYKIKLAKFRRRRNYHIRRIKKYPQMVPIITISVLLVATAIFVVSFRNKPVLTGVKGSKIVIITDAGVRQIVPSNDKTVGQLLHRLHIKIHQGDVVQPSLTTAIDQADFRINIFRAKPVEIIDGTQKIYTYSAAKTPRAIAEQTGQKLYAADYVIGKPTENFLASASIGEQVVIDRATPVNINLYGQKILIRTHAKTVGDLIKQEKIKLTSSDQVVPSSTTPLTSSTEVFIIRKGIKIQSVTQSIPMPIQTVYDSSLAFGESAVVQQGSAGQEVTTYKENTQNGYVVSKSLLQTIVTQPAVTEIVDEGTSLSGTQGDMALAGIPPSDYYYVNYIVSHESGWCPTKWQGDIGYCPPIFTQQYSDYAGVGYGLCQSTPPIKMSSFGSDWATNPITQLEWCNNYALSRYGSWYNAYEHWRYYRNW